MSTPNTLFMPSFASVTFCLKPSFSPVHVSITSSFFFENQSETSVPKADCIPSLASVTFCLKPSFNPFHASTASSLFLRTSLLCRPQTHFLWLHLLQLLFVIYLPLNHSILQQLLLFSFETTLVLHH